MIDINFGKAIQIEGWMEPYELLWLSAQAQLAKQICEVGSWKGRSTRALVDNTTGNVLAVDTWAGTNDPNDPAKTDNPDELLQEFLSNMKGLPEGRLAILRATSLEAAKDCALRHQVFDMIFIDASHVYEDVKADILAWFPLLIEGGIICGHDYMYKWQGVIQAVNELFPNHTMVADTIWAIKKEGKRE